MVDSLLGAPFGVALDTADRLYISCSNAILVYTTRGGTLSRVAAITGANTGLRGSNGIAVDQSGKLYVANSPSGGISVYAAGASGNVAPVATIAGSQTLLLAPVGIAVDGAGRVYVASSNNPSLSPLNRVTVYTPGATGNVAPIAVIEGSNTGLNYPWGIALDTTGNLYVANSWGKSVTIFAPGANGNVSPATTIVGGNTGLNVLTGLTVDANRHIYVGDGRWMVYVFAAGSSGNVAPMATIAGDNTGLNIPGNLAVDRAGAFYVTNWMINTVTIYAAGTNGNATPRATIVQADQPHP